MPPSPLRSMLLRGLMPASGHRDHTASPSANAPTKATRRTWYPSRRSFSEGGSAPFVKGASASIASSPASVTIAIRPSCGVDTGINKCVSTKQRSGIFFVQRLDRSIDWPVDLPARLTPKPGHDESRNVSLTLRGVRGLSRRRSDHAEITDKAFVFPRLRIHRAAATDRTEARLPAP